MEISAPDKKTVLRYLGCRGEKIEPLVNEMIDGCIADTSAVASPKYIYRRFVLERECGGLRPAGTHILLEGSDIAGNLEGCGEAYILCATIGFEIEQLIRRNMVASPAKSLILDACASVAVEELTDRVNAEIDKECAARGERTTVRFSPGYGDLPLTVQKSIIEEMDCCKKIGLGLTDSMMMTPSKSVTAIIGVLK